MQKTDIAPKLSLSYDELTEPALSVLEEVIASIKDIDAEERATLLIEVIHQIFQRSVNELFSTGSSSFQLPKELVSRYQPCPEAIPLPEPAEIPRATLSESLNLRASSRNFSKTPIKLEELSSFLYWAVGVRDYMDGYGVKDLPLFRYPSTGGLPAFDVEMIVSNVEGLEAGYYRYHPVGHSLELLGKGAYRNDFGQYVFENNWLFFAPVVLTFVHDLRVSRWKYHTRAYRFSHIDLGAALQNVYLVAAAMSWACCAVAGFLDELANKSLSLNGRDRFLSLLVGLGNPGYPTAHST
jgi:SagB-type dehydrogenase family enzyme